MNETRGRRAGVDDRVIKDQIKKQLTVPEGDEAIVTDSDDDVPDVPGCDTRCKRYCLFLCFTSAYQGCQN
jgi:hypothetical protein